MQLQIYSFRYLFIHPQSDYDNNTDYKQYNKVKAGLCLCCAKNIPHRLVNLSEVLQKQFCYIPI